MQKALAFLALAGIAAAQGGNFTLSCENITLTSAPGDASTLDGYCHTHSIATPYRTTTIDLNDCLGLDQSTGALVWAYMGKFSNYCRDCTLVPLATSTEMLCLCEPLNGRFITQTCINLDDEVSNNAGTYSCPNVTGT